MSRSEEKCKSNIMQKPKYQLCQSINHELNSSNSPWSHRITKQEQATFPPDWNGNATAAASVPGTGTLHTLIFHHVGCKWQLRFSINASQVIKPNSSNLPKQIENTEHRTHRIKWALRIEWLTGQGWREIKAISHCLSLCHTHMYVRRHRLCCQIGTDWLECFHLDKIN